MGCIFRVYGEKKPFNGLCPIFLGERYPWHNQARQIWWRSLKGFRGSSGSNFSISHWLCWSSLQHSHTTVWACDANIVCDCRSFSDINVTQGSVATHMRFSEMFNKYFAANLLENLTVKKVWKSVLRINRVTAMSLVFSFVGTRCSQYNIYRVASFDSRPITERRCAIFSFCQRRYASEVLDMARCLCVCHMRHVIIVSIWFSS